MGREAGQGSSLGESAAVCLGHAPKEKESTEGRGSVRGSSVAAASS